MLVAWHAAAMLCCHHRDVAVLMVQPDGVQLKQMRRVDTDESRISISVQQGPPGGPLATTTRHLLRMRRILKVGLAPQPDSACCQAVAGLCSDNCYGECCAAFATAVLCCVCHSGACRGGCG